MNFSALCHSCGQYKPVEFSAVHGLVGTYMIARGAWSSANWRAFCSWKCLMQDCATWAAATEPVNRVPLAQRAKA